MNSLHSSPSPMSGKSSLVQNIPELRAGDLEQGSVPWSLGIIQQILRPDEQFSGMHLVSKHRIIFHHPYSGNASHDLCRFPLLPPVLRPHHTKLQKWPQKCPSRSLVLYHSHTCGLHYRCIEQRQFRPLWLCLYYTSNLKTEIYHWPVGGTLSQIILYWG